MPITDTSVPSLSSLAGVLTDGAILDQLKTALLELIGSLPADLSGQTSINSNGNPVVPALGGTPGVYTIGFSGSCYLQGRAVQAVPTNTLAIPANPGGSNRIDLVCAQKATAATNGRSKQFMVTPPVFSGNALVAAPTFSDGTFNDELQTATLVYVEGSSPTVPPSVPVGYVSLCQITVLASNGTMNASDLQMTLPGFSGVSGSDLVVDVTTYGAKGDNSTLNDVFIANAVAAVIAQGGGTLYFPTGNYLISHAITITNANLLIIAGAGQSSNIQANGDFDIIYVPSTVSGGNQFGIRDISITGPGETANLAFNGSGINIGGDGGGVTLASVSDFYMERVFVDSVGYAMKYFAKGGRKDIIGCHLKGVYVGVWNNGHGLDYYGTTVNGGTYGMVTDGGADPKWVGGPLFGCLSWLSINSTGVYKGGTVYGYDLETNYGPPPFTSGTQAFVAIGLSGTPTNGQTHSYKISGDIVACAESSTNSPSQQATFDAAQITAYFANPNNFPQGTSDNDYLLVTASATGTTVTITATEVGRGGNKIKFVCTNSGTMTLTPGSGNLASGSDNGIWPGATGDTVIGPLAAASFVTVGCGGMMVCGDHAQMNLIVPWVKDGIVVGTQHARLGPGYNFVSGGNVGSSVKGLTQASAYAIDIRQAGYIRVSDVVISTGGQATGASVHIPTSTWLLRAAIFDSNTMRVNGGNFAVVGDDNTGICKGSDNYFLQNNGTMDPGGYVQNGSTHGLGPNWNWDNNDGFNPYGYLDAPTFGATGSSITNTYGQTTEFCLTGGVNITGLLIAGTTAAATDCGYRGGFTTFTMLPGETMTIQFSGGGSAPTVKVFGK